jgi:hypothetical protein
VILSGGLGGIACGCSTGSAGSASSVGRSSVAAGATTEHNTENADHHYERENLFNHQTPPESLFILRMSYDISHWALYPFASTSQLARALQHYSQTFQ